MWRWRRPSAEATPSRRTRTIVWLRATGCCERCAAPFPHQGKHVWWWRCREAGDRPANILLACVSCTHELRRNRAIAIQDGWLVARHTAPESVSVRVRWRGFVYMDTQGGYSRTSPSA